MRHSLTTVVLVLLLAGVAQTLQAQAPSNPPPKQGQPAPPQQVKPAAPRAAQPSRGAVTFFLTDSKGTPIPEAALRLTGPVTREGTTNKDGVLRLQNVRNGNYRVRAEAERFITLERDIAARGGLEVEMTLNEAPEPQEPPDPEPAPEPEKTTAAPTTIAPDPSATISLSSVVEFFSKNKLGRNEPHSESVQGKYGEATSSLLQVRDTLEARSHGAADEVLYVINGRASLNSKGRIYPVETGSLILIPRGVTYSIANQGRDPLWALSVLAGQ
jgi:mannose-6-phosphate isomerase-like protein (cupin superfamily)